jgi:hypothetical protein
MTLKQQKLEEIAELADLHFSSDGTQWAYNHYHPHITTFAYRIQAFDKNTDEPKCLGTVNGYRITQDWTVEDDLELWNEADALDGDVVRYVDALIRELRACQQLCAVSSSLTMAQRVTILRHVEALESVDSSWLVQSAAASLAMMDAPAFMLVDPRKMPSERGTPSGRLQGRSHTAKLLDIGFVRMVSARFVWGWNRELSETLMDEYSYEKLLEAREQGILDAQLNCRLMEEVYGDMPEDIARIVDLPEPSDMNDEQD